MPEKEATARIKINRLLEAAGWRFFADKGGPANIRLEPGATLKYADLEALGNDFEATGKGFVDFLLLDAKGFPLLVLEAKAEDKNPLVGKEQARKYARAQNCRFVILSNGNLFPSCFSDSVVGLIPKPGTDARYLEVVMRTKKQHLNDIAPQAAQKNINIEILKTVEIPLPPLATQQAIVAEIEAEQALVNANRELVARYEKKIQATLARV